MGAFTSNKGTCNLTAVRAYRTLPHLSLDLEARKAGFRQIQLMDLYCLARGNEMWAIIPSIKRVGHDVDPLSCLHWRPCLEDIPEDVRPFWTEQSRAFGQKILAVISSAM